MKDFLPSWETRLLLKKLFFFLREHFNYQHILILLANLRKENSERTTTGLWSISTILVVLFNYVFLKSFKKKSSLLHNAIFSLLPLSFRRINVQVLNTIEMTWSETPQAETKLSTSTCHSQSPASSLYRHSARSPRATDSGGQRNLSLYTQLFLGFPTSE